MVAGSLRRLLVQGAICAALAFTLLSCFVAISFDEYDARAAVPEFSVTATVAGLDDGVKASLSLNLEPGGDVANDEPFEFPSRLARGTKFAVRAIAPGHECDDAVDVVGDADVRVVVRCVANDPSLVGLSFTRGAFVATVSLKPEVTEYQAHVPLLPLATSIIATTRSPSARLTIAGSPVASGESRAVPFQAAPIPLQIRVVAASGAERIYTVVLSLMASQRKEPNAPGNWLFDNAVALSGDTLAVGIRDLDSSAGEVYVFTRTAGIWSQQARLVASNRRPSALFGYSIALAGDTLAVGAMGESSNAKGIGGNQADTSAPDAGAVYVFRRTIGVWSQEAYLKASNTRAGSRFGWSVALAGDTLAVGAVDESSNAKGIGGDQTNTSAPHAGAVYVFTRTAGAWSQQAYLKASNTRPNTLFGASLAMSDDTLAVGAHWESSSATGVNGIETDTSATRAGAVYVFVRTAGAWSQQAYVKASNTGAEALFGESVALSGDTLAVGAVGERSNALAVNGDQTDTSAPEAGAVYVFARTAGIWTQHAYLKASNTRAGSWFGRALALRGDVLVVGAPRESSNATGVSDYASPDTSFTRAGAAYLFARADGLWVQRAYVKASSTRPGAEFGASVALSSDQLAVGASKDVDSQLKERGAVYVY